jgi:hypothetical protein
MSGKRTFQLSNAFFQRFYRFHFWLTGALVLLGVCCGVFISWKEKTRIGESLVASTIVSGLLGICVHLAYLRRVKQLRSFRIVMTSDSITRVQGGAIDVIVQRDDVRSIFEVPGGGLLIYGSGVSEISIPASIAGYDECRSNLSQWRKLEPRD